MNRTSKLELANGLLEHQQRDWVEKSTDPVFSVQ
jgi:hypothetical protein